MDTTSPVVSPCACDVVYWITSVPAVAAVITSVRAAVTVVVDAFVTVTGKVVTVVVGGVVTNAAWLARTFALMSV
jgi:hypothetical protein